eukprot:TRINITY_DN1515_c0_g2_i1.p1 TRINITY_DN1515_c0_g2~~TRINITY_DN1515_c0_g2_i1.p1  ORF type:complete len:198 (+),score=54.37 TRINITY_DN1515_c0_g2_i1:59-652(+)
MNDILSQIQETFDGFLDQVVTSHEDAFSELGSAWKNSTFGEYELSLEGMQSLVGKAGEQAYDEAMGFYKAVDWSEDWLKVMGGVHAAVWLVWLGTVIFGSSSNFKIGFFLTIALLTSSASYINQYGIDNWKDFATQNYFDPNGTFLAVTWCLPMLVLLFLILMQILIDVGRLLVKVKVQQFKKEKGKKDAKETKKTK